MKAFIATISAAVLGISSLSFVNSASADTFSISVVDGTFSYSDDEYVDDGYSETPVYIVTNSWSPPPDYYYNNSGRRYGHHGHHRGHHKNKHHKRHRRQHDRYYRHHR